MSLSSLTRSDSGGAVAHRDHLAGAKAVYYEYVTESEVSYQKCLVGLTAVPPVGPSDAERAVAVGEPAPAYWKYAGAVREAGLPALWAAGLTAVRAVAAYYKFVTRLAAVPAADLADAQPPAGMSNAERAAAAAAESAAAYQKYVAGPAAVRAAELADAQLPAGMSNAERAAAAAAESAAAYHNDVAGPPAAQREGASPDGWSPAVEG